MYPLFLVMIGGAAGAGARHLVGRAALAMAGPGWPAGTLTVNLVGGLLMGMLAGALARFGQQGEPLRLLLSVGMLGGFTTFSAFSLDLALMLQRGAWGAAMGYALISVIGSTAALFAGLAVTRAVTA